MPLDMLRLAPSSHNYQPWRVLQLGSSFHFYLQRTSGFGPGTPMFVLLGLADLQRMEIGIAMCHFELAARELNLTGKWSVQEPNIPQSAIPLEYVVTWISTPNQETRQEKSLEESPQELSTTHSRTEGMVR